MEPITLIATLKTIGIGLTTVVTGASVLAKLTKTKKDDRFFAKISGFLDFFALNSDKVKK